jgi:nifR3 family TIM-barrel protein
VIRPLQVGALTTPTNLWLAPLAGWTSLAFRRAVRGLGGVGLAVTEVVSAQSLAQGNRKTWDLVRFHAEDRPTAVQLGAASQEHATVAAQRLQERGADAVDLNLGCPVRKLNRKGKGAALLRSPEDAAELAAAVVAAVSIPVTAKLRLGWSAQEETAPEVARALEEAGVAAITVHGRTRAQAFAGAVDLAGIRRVVEAVQRVPVIANGDVLTVADVRRTLGETGAAGVMIGRGAIEDPWLFRDAVAQLRDGEAPKAPAVDARVELVRRHFAALADEVGEPHAARVFRKILKTYALALGAGEALVREAVTLRDRAHLEAMLARLGEAPGRPTAPRGTLVPTPKLPVDKW